MQYITSSPLHDGGGGNTTSHMWSQSVGVVDEYLTAAVTTQKGTLPAFQRLTSNSSYGSSNSRANQYTALSNYGSQSDTWSGISHYDANSTYTTPSTMLANRHRMTAPTHLTASESLSMCKSIFFKLCMI